MLRIVLAQLLPSTPHLTGATIGESHAAQIRNAVTSNGSGGIALLDFAGIENASASYLKRILPPFFSPAGSEGGLPFEMSPVLLNANEGDLVEELRDYLAGKDQVLLVAREQGASVKYSHIIGELDGAANETFNELMALNETTAAQLYERHRHQTTNQTAWNNRLAQLVDLRLARRRREGRFWIYQPTVTSN